MNVMITNHQSDFETKLAEIFMRENHRVFIHNKTPVEEIPHIDYLIDTTDFRDGEDNFDVTQGINGVVIERVFRQNVLSPMALLETYLPLLDKGKGKRLFYLTSAAASINETQATDAFGYNMSKAALHQFIQLVRNKLADKGYTFRVFDPMLNKIPPQAAAEAAYHYITRRRGTENHDPRRDDEDILVFRDAEGRQHTW